MEVGVDPLPVDPTLTAVPEVAAPTVRGLLDNTALSAGLTMSTDGSGVLRFLPWPLTVDTASPVEVVDCLGRSELAASAIDYRADDADLLNVAVIATAEHGTATATDVPSVSEYGRRTRAYGFPLKDIRASLAAAQALADAAVARHGRVTHRVESVSVSVATDPRWTAILAGLDVGRQVIVNRVGLPAHVSAFDCYVVGFQYDLTPEDWTATLYLSTTTATL